ncbi:hypothetical protein [Streptomyces sp. CB01881]|uniref:hypothetical protein n=1 Tax=Streptomyces sp. CB01881 TaxID=2078691 RepID=UPI000CDBE5A6|nr:hypothetical protein [Streptomyces sp. CB01881]AUY53625.1 hypothetical protein C2142_37765 [Streptomyces sp. CB01881]TYC68641.1 hypothetical protein EH183_37775 [Streptomyces sp. CB01881]
MSDRAWPARLSPQAGKAFVELPPHVQQMAGDLLDIASCAPWGWPQWDATDPEGEDMRCASIGQLSLVYLVNRLSGRLHVISIVWLG